jgi:predicted MPP superfamily phosphohydrolase
MNRRRFLKWAVGTAVTGTLAGLAYGRFEAGWVRVDRRTVRVPRLPAAFDGTTVAVVADPHHGPFLSRDDLSAIVDRTNGLGADLVALVGDYVQESRDHAYLRPAIEELARLRAPLGVFAVPGNHDHQDGIHRLRELFAEQRLTDLTNDGRWIERPGGRLRIAGVDDLWYGRPDVGAALGDATANDACLLLCHNPDLAERLRDRRVSLMLSGHMHGGQIVIPKMGHPRLPSRYGTKYLAGLCQGPCVKVFVSRGLGTTTLPFRFRCRPEINLLTLKPTV